MPDGADGNESSNCGNKGDSMSSKSPSGGLTLDLCAPTITIQEPSPMVEVSPDEVLSAYTPQIVTVQASTDQVCIKFTVRILVDKESEPYRLLFFVSYP